MPVRAEFPKCAFQGEHVGKVTLPARRVGGALGVTGMAILRGLARGREHLRRRGLDPEQVARQALRKGD